MSQMMGPPAPVRQFGSQGFGYTPRLILPTDAQLQQFEAFQRATGPQPTLARGIGDAIRSEWVSSFLPTLLDRFSDARGTLELTPEVLDDLTVGIDQELWDEFAYARNMDDALKTRDRLIRLTQARARLQEMGWTGIGLQLAAAVLDPAFIVAGTFAEPWAFAAKGTRLQRIARAGLTLGGIEASLEATASVVDPQRTWVDVLVSGVAAGAFSSGAAWWSAYRLTQKANAAAISVEAQGTAMASVESLIRRSPGMADELIQKELTDLGLHDLTPADVRQEWEQLVTGRVTILPEELDSLQRVPLEELPEQIRWIVQQMNELGNLTIRQMDWNRWRRANELAEDEILDIAKQLDTFEMTDLPEYHTLSAEAQASYIRIGSLIKAAKMSRPHAGADFIPPLSVQWKSDGAIGLSPDASTPGGVLKASVWEDARSLVAELVEGRRDFGFGDLRTMRDALPEAAKSEDAAKFLFGTERMAGKVAASDIPKLWQTVWQLRETRARETRKAVFIDRITEAVDEYDAFVASLMPDDEIAATIRTTELPESEVGAAVVDARRTDAEARVADQLTDAERVVDLPDELTESEIPPIPGVSVPAVEDAMAMIDAALDDLQNLEAADFLRDDAVFQRRVFAEQLRNGTFFAIREVEFTTPWAPRQADLPFNSYELRQPSVEGMVALAIKDADAGDIDYDALTDAVDSAKTSVRDTRALLTLKKELGRRFAEAGYATEAEFSLMVSEIDRFTEGLDQILGRLDELAGDAVRARLARDRGDITDPVADILETARLIGYETGQVNKLNRIARSTHLQDSPLGRPQIVGAREEEVALRDMFDIAEAVGVERDVASRVWNAINAIEDPKDRMIMRREVAVALALTKPGVWAKPSIAPDDFIASVRAASAGDMGKGITELVQNVMSASKKDLAESAKKAAKAIRDNKFHTGLPIAYIKRSRELLDEIGLLPDGVGDLPLWLQAVDDKSQELADALQKQAASLNRSKNQARIRSIRDEIASIVADNAILNQYARLAKDGDLASAVDDAAVAADDVAVAVDDAAPQAEAVVEAEQPVTATTETEPAQPMVAGEQRRTEQVRMSGGQRRAMDDDEMAALGLFTQPAQPARQAPQPASPAGARKITPARAETQRTLADLKPEELNNRVPVQRGEDGEFQDLDAEISRVAMLLDSDGIDDIPVENISTRSAAAAFLRQQEDALNKCRDAARNSRGRVIRVWDRIRNKYQPGVKTPLHRLIRRIQSDIEQMDEAILVINDTINRMKDGGDIDPRVVVSRDLVKSNANDARAAVKAFRARYISRIDGIDTEIDRLLEQTKQMLVEPEIRTPGAIPDDPIEIDGPAVIEDNLPPDEPPSVPDRFDGGLPDDIPRIGESEATRFDRFVNRRLRFSMAAALGKSRSNMTRLAGALLADDTLMFLRGVKNRISLSEWRTRQIQRRLTEFYRVTGPLLIEFASSKRGKKVGPLGAMRYREQFYILVGRAVRGGAAADQIMRDFPPVAKAAEHIKKHNRDLLRMAKAFRVKGFDAIPEDEFFMMRIWKPKQIDMLVNEYGEQQMVEFIAGALKNAADEPMSDALARRLSKGLLHKIRTVEQARLAGVDPHWMTKTDADLVNDLIEEQRVVLEALVGKANQGDITELEQVLEEIKIKIRGAVGDQSGNPMNAKRRVRIDEAYESIFKAEGKPETRVVLGELLEENAESLTHVYTEQMISNMALRKFHDRMGSDNMDTIRIRMMEEGASKSELDKIELLYKSVGGMRIGATGAIAEAGRLLRAYQYLRVMNQVGFAQIAEIPIAVASGGFAATVASLPTLGHVFRQASDGKLSNEMLREIEAIWAAGTDYLRHQPYSRFDGTQQYLGDFGNTLEQKNRVLQKVTSTISGFAAVDTALQRMALTIGINKFANIARTGKLPSAKRLAAMGLDEDMARRIVRQIAGDKKAGVAGYSRLEEGPLGVSKVTQLNLGYWDDQEAAAAFIGALQIWSKRVVQQNDIGAYAAWMTSDWGKIFIQFRSFVISAWEKQFLYGLTTRDLETWTIWAMTSVFAGLAYTAQTYANSLGRNDAEEYRKERLSTEAIGRAAFARAGYSSFLPAIADEALLRTGYEPWFSGIRSSQLATSFVSGNPSVDFLNNLTGGIPRALLAPMASSSYQFSQQDLHNIIRALPFSNALGVRQVVDAVSSPLPARSRVED